MARGTRYERLKNRTITISDRIYNKPPIYPVPAFGRIDNLAVHERIQNQGVGSRLVADVRQWLQDRKIERIECVAACRNPKALAFWRKMGFREFAEQLVFK